MERILVLFVKEGQNAPFITATKNIAEEVELPFVVKDTTEENSAMIASELELSELPALVLGLHIEDTLFWHLDMLKVFGYNIINTSFVSEQVKLKLLEDPEDLTKA